MNLTLRTAEDIYDEMLALAVAPVETAGVLLTRLVPVDESRAVLLAVALVPVPNDAYEIRTDRSLQITSDGYVHALKLARDRGLVALWVHSHPGDGAVVRPSVHDQVVNAELEGLFADRTGSGEYGYLVLGHEGGSLTFTGALAGPLFGPISRLSVIGQRLVFRSAQDAPGAAVDELFDRHIRAFGSQIQKMIGTLTVAVVGAGGTGSAVAEQLIRLGVRTVVLLDPDDLSQSNTTRVYGSTPQDVGRSKVDVLGDHLERIAEGVTTVRIRDSVVREDVARALTGADVVFGCTDDNAGRLRLSRLPYFHLVPVIDCGVLLDASTDGMIRGIFGRVTTVLPGAACLMCRGRVDPLLAEAETRTEAEQRKLVKEGYAPSLPGVEPAVVAFTTMVAAAAVNELLERLVGYGNPDRPSELLLRIHDRAISLNEESPQAGHYCDPAHPKVGTDLDMYLGLNWIS